MRTFQRFLGVTSSSFIVACKLSLCQNSSNCDKKENVYVLAVISEQSQANLKEYLEMNGYKGYKGSTVVINKVKNDKFGYFEYEPLFNERAAFRLKGIVKSKSGEIAVNIILHFIYIKQLVTSITILFNIDFSRALVGCRS